MEWLQNLLNGENGNAVQLVLISLALVALLIIVFWIFRKITGASAPKSSKNRIPRLSVTDSSRVDETRYLVLVRRDNVEHLVMIGGPSDIVIESNIVRIPETSSTPNPETSQKPPVPSAPKSEPAPQEASIAIPATIAASTASVAASTTTIKQESETTSATEPPVVVEAPAQTEADIESLDLAQIGEELTQSISNEVEPSGVDLEASISERLDEVLSSESMDIDLSSNSADGTIESAAVEATSNADQKGSDAADDMQRLLDELAGTKEPAQ